MGMSSSTPKPVHQVTNLYKVDEPTEEESTPSPPKSPVKRMTLELEDGTLRVWEGVQLSEYKAEWTTTYMLAYAHGCSAKGVAPTRTIVPPASV